MSENKSILKPDSVAHYKKLQERNAELESHSKDPNLVSMGDKFWDKANGDIVLVPNVPERKPAPNPNKLKFNDTVKTSDGNDEQLKNNQGSGAQYRKNHKLEKIEKKKETLPSIEKPERDLQDAISKLKSSATAVGRNLPPIHDNKEKKWTKAKQPEAVKLPPINQR